MWSILSDIVCGLVAGSAGCEVQVDLQQLSELRALMLFFPQYEVKAPMPSACFRNICKQMAKMHEAIFDLLPEEQTQVRFWVKGHLPVI